MSDPGSRFRMSSDEVRLTRKKSNKSRRWTNNVWELFGNSFCATGPGGGIDATCSPRGGRRGKKAPAKVELSPGAPEFVGPARLKQVREQVRAKAAAAPVPTQEQRKKAEDRIAALGGDINEYRNQIKGNVSDRAHSRKRLMKEFGDGQSCPCGYCGRKLVDKTLTRDKIYTSREGGRYIHANLIPACEGCNKSRGDTPFGEIKWST
jgi:5-methylcytosine-specific restriction endonuclease McrA